MCVLCVVCVLCVCVCVVLCVCCVVCVLCCVCVVCVLCVCVVHCVCCVCVCVCCMCVCVCVCVCMCASYVGALIKSHIPLQHKVTIATTELPPPKITIRHCKLYALCAGKYAEHATHLLSRGRVINHPYIASI